MSAPEVTTSSLSPQPQTTCRVPDTLKAAILGIVRVASPLRFTNYDVRCEALDVTGSGQDNIPPCGKPTARCPGCGEFTDFCEDHLFEQECGVRVCLDCDGLPEFRKFPAASEMDADDYDAQFQKAVR